ncbi:MAG: ABC transporter ATP-binding protein [Spirochaetales bacterium]|nr:ABC transporter ATP-binding protein [Spirochaetales bacterium]MCF7937352.1 ABC transporter ATP-binding protein [Spirochaetales bacterium]
MSESNCILDTRALTMDFGGLRAVDAMNLKVCEGEIVALIGPNGAGKTTFFNCVTGMLKPSLGTIVITMPDGQEKEIQGKRPNVVTNYGLARTFQNIRLFQNLTVLENVMIGRHTRMKAGILGAVLRNKATKEEEERVIYESYEYLKKLHLEQHVNELAKNLPYGAQRRLEIARAMATEPFLLLLDEPAAGMNPQETRELDNLIVKIRDTEKITILLIEHDMNLVMSLSERIYVMDYGKLIAQGTPEEIKHHPEVIKAYLGEEVDA